MKKNILLGIFATVAMLVSAQQIQIQQAPRAMASQAVAEESLSMEFGYCGTMTSQIGWGEAGTIRAVIEVPQEVSAKYQGAQITRVLTGMGNDGGSNAKIIIMRTLNDTDLLYSQNTKFTAKEWNEIELETPFTIDGEGFYIGYEVTVTSKDSYPVGVDSEVPSPYGDICAMYSTEEKRWIWEHLSEYDFGNNCIKFILTGDNLPRYNMALQSANVKEYRKTGDPFSVTCTAKNLAALTVESFEASYKIGDKEAVVVPFTCDIASGEATTFTIDSITIEQDGTYDFTLEIVSVNGNTDEDNSDNILTYTVNSMSNIVPRKVLIEEFSTTQCANCPAVQAVVKEIMEGRDDISLVVHHAGYGQDNYTISASRSYLKFYDGSTYAPALMLDRTNLADQGAVTYVAGQYLPAPAPVFAPSSKKEIEKFLNYCFEQPAFVSVNIEDTYNPETRELTVRVYGESVIELPQTPFLNIFITESGMLNYQSGAGNDYEHNHAIRAVLTSTWGDELEFNGFKYDETRTYVLEEKWKPENMDIVAFIAHYDGTDLNNCNVFNSEHKELDYDSSAAKLQNDAVSVWAANGMIYIAGSYDKAEVFAIDGSLVATAQNATAIDVENNGIYVVRVDGNSYKVVL